jgi:hypothetical protein
MECARRKFFFTEDTLMALKRCPQDADALFFDRVPERSQGRDHGLDTAVEEQVRSVRVFLAGKSVTGKPESFVTA